MKKSFVTYIILLLAGFMVNGAEIVRTDSYVSFTETTDAGKLMCSFKKCMANDLFTFYQVWLDGKLVNSAQYSDNIGPFLVTNYGWIGGNHLSDTGKKTAKTVDITVKVDGADMPAGTVTADAVEIEVVNELYMPDGSIFAIETVKYLVAGNSIEVWATHDFKIASEVTVDRYYGMQSMFMGETEILAPCNQKYNKWLTFTPGGAANSINIKKYGSGEFSVFVEKSDKGCQASYMVREDLGARGKVGYEDVVYIGNSYEKSYHKLMGSSKIKPGDTTAWHGVYSWYKEPATDTFATQADAPEYIYPAYMGGRPVMLKVDATGAVTQQPQSGVADFIADIDADTTYYSLNGSRLASPTPGSICLCVRGGEASKILVK